MTMEHWAVPLIGKPWEFGAKGPDAFDCWGLACWVQRLQYGIELRPVGYSYSDWRESAIAVQEAEERKHWTKVAQPADGDLVLMARSRRPVHIGVWIRANGTFGALHCLEGLGVTFTPAGTLRLAGWGSLQYFRHETRCTS